jgi:uncharacterized phage-associated protein
MSIANFDFDRALNALLYVASRVEQPDMHKVFKVLYFADMAHLYLYGRAITGDRYVAMKYGPVPSAIYDMVKVVKGESWYVDENLKAFFGVDGFTIIPLRDADNSYLSATDVEQLDSSIAKYASLNFGQRTKVSHGSAWQKAWDNPTTDDIAIEDILTECGADQNFISFVVENITAQKEMAQCSR